MFALIHPSELFPLEASILNMHKRREGKRLVFLILCYLEYTMLHFFKVHNTLIVIDVIQPH